MSDLTQTVSVPIRIIGSDDYWQMMLEKNEWTIADIADSCGIQFGTVNTYAARLVKGGYAEIVSVTKRKSTYRLIKRPLQKPRLKADGTEHEETAIETLWRSMRMAKTFTVGQFIEFSNSRSEPIAKTTVRHYLRDLSEVGIVARVATKSETYCLIRNLGSRAPRVLSTHIVFDPNARVVVGVALAKEVQP